jgi:hypothetical protein
MPGAAIARRNGGDVLRLMLVALNDHQLAYAARMSGVEARRLAAYRDELGALDAAATQRLADHLFKNRYFVKGGELGRATVPLWSERPSRRRGSRSR